eukprot:TRINITY_DN38816_c0_g1_i1.p1 TRINITY_DN38816_c0_g1~~TRINITY_DN38816_c0_g1_i1.p1  ORF type:complete len:529 (-),score=93.50 TRINITY_DN38816_c0_g1_i1:93-1634(-)
MSHARASPLLPLLLLLLPSLLLLQPAAGRSSCDFERVDGQQLTVQEFSAHFRTGPRRPGRPVVLTGLSLGPGLAQLTQPKGSVSAAIADAAASASKDGFGPGWNPEVFKAGLGKMMVLPRHAEVWNNTFGGNQPETGGLSEPSALGLLFARSDPTLFILKPSNSAIASMAEGLELPEILRTVQLTGPQLSLGGENASSPPHRHPENWFAQLHGKKSWVMTPANVVEESGPERVRYIPASDEAMKSVSPCDVRDEANVGFQRCLLDEGEILYLPSNWHHSTCNIGGFSLGVGYIGALDHLPKVHLAAATGDRKGLETSLAAEQPRKALDSKDRDGKTPLHWAAQQGHAKMVRHLLISRADAHAADSHGARPSHAAAFAGHSEALRELMKDHASTATAQSLQGSEPLHLAATAGHTKVAKLLLWHRAEAYASDKKGAEPLHMAAYEGHLPMVELLLAKKASPHTGAGDGTEPAKLAMTRGHRDVAQKLKEASEGESKKAKDQRRKVLGPLIPDEL